MACVYQKKEWLQVCRCGIEYVAFLFLFSCTFVVHYSVHCILYYNCTCHVQCTTQRVVTTMTPRPHTCTRSNRSVLWWLSNAALLWRCWWTVELQNWVRLASRRSAASDKIHPIEQHSTRSSIWPVGRGPVLVQCRDGDAWAKRILLLGIIFNHEKL